jgi:predicted AAA+ superfamily ATPase
MNQEIRIALEKQNPWWFGKEYEKGMERLSHYELLLKCLKTPDILLILGARRTGKSTLLYQIITSLNITSESILFMNLDEPLFQSKAEDPLFLSTIIEEYMAQKKHIQKFYVFIDEVQNYEYWVQTLKTMHDTNKRIKFILTGSTAALIKNKISTRLSGRYLATTIYPLSYKEFLQFNKSDSGTITEKKEEVKKYLQFGAFPRVVLEPDETLKQEILKNYFQTIYLKDIIYPHKLRNNKDVFEILYYLISNVGTPLSYTSIGKNLGIATDTVKEYIEYAEEAYLLYTVSKFEHAVKKQIVNPKKIYCLDTGLINAISFKFSENKGRIIENLVFMTLKRKEKEIYYHKGLKECDFVVKEGLKVATAIQVTVSMKDQNVREREIIGLLEAMEMNELKQGYIITEEEKENIVVDGKEIFVVPLYEWLEKMA